MNSLYQVLFIVVPFLASCASATFHQTGQAHNTTELEFTFPKAGRFDYEFTEGDKAIVEWEPEIKLSEVYLNCSSTQKFNGRSEAGEIQFINAHSGSLYLPNWDPDKGDNTFCTFCAGPDAKTCSGVFHLVGRKNNTKPKVWSSTGTFAPRPERNDSCSCTASKSTSSNYTVPPTSTISASAQRSPTPSLGFLPYPSKNISAPYQNATSYSATSLRPSTAIPTIVTAAGSPTKTAPYTTITPQPVGWNTTNSNSTGVRTIVQTIEVPPNTFNPSTASRVPSPATPAAASSAIWNSNVNSAMLGLVVVGAGVFVML